jgi:septal ring factor EnvC (AmiA/AmiB activator)
VHQKPKKILIFVLFFLFTFLIVKPIFAGIDEDIAKIKKQIADLETAIAPLQKESTGLSSKITLAKSQIDQIESQMNELSQKLIEKEADLEVQKKLLGERVKRYYKNTKNYNSFIILFSENNENNSLFEQYAWYQSIISQDKNTITQYSTDITK